MAKMLFGYGVGCLSVVEEWGLYLRKCTLEKE